MGKFNSDDHYIYYCGQESLRWNGVALIINKRFWNTVLRCKPKNDRMISVHFQSKPFHITAIQDYALTTDAKEAEVDQFYKDLDLLELTPKKICSIHHCGLECKSRKSGYIWSNRQVWPWKTKWSRAKVKWIMPRECTRKYPLSTIRDNITHGYHQIINTEIKLIIFFVAKDGEAVHSQQKQNLDLTAAQIISCS